jgi:hypothetical protein
VRKRSRRRKRKISQEGGGAVGGKRGSEISIVHKLGDRMMVRRLKIGRCEREERSVSKYVCRTGRASVCV